MNFLFILLIIITFHNYIFQFKAIAFFWGGGGDSSYKKKLEAYTNIIFSEYYMSMQYAYLLYRLRNVNQYK